MPAEALKDHEAHHAAVRDLVEEEDWEAAATSAGRPPLPSRRLSSHPPP